jgi:hypothetical protein
MAAAVAVAGGGAISSTCFFLRGPSFLAKVAPVNPDAMDRIVSHSAAPPHESPSLSPDDTPPFPPAPTSSFCNLRGLPFLDEALLSSSSTMLLYPDSKKQAPTRVTTSEAATIPLRRGIFIRFPRRGKSRGLRRMQSPNGTTSTVPSSQGCRQRGRDGRGQDQEGMQGPQPALEAICDQGEA